MTRSRVLVNNRRLVAVLCLVGFIVTAVYVMYLAVTLPHWQQRSPNVLTLLRILCPFAFLDMMFIDMPATAWDSAVLWTIISLLNAGLFGMVGAVLINLTKRSQRMSTRTGSIAFLVFICAGMIAGESAWRLICFGLAVVCLIAVWQYNRLSTILDIGKTGDGKL